MADAAGLFTAQLYLRDAAGYDEDRTLSASGVADGRGQALRFVLPAGVHGLRLDPAEQPGLLHLNTMRLLRDGQLVWQWRGDTDGWRVLAASAHQQILPVASSTPSGLMLLIGDDPWIELPVAAEAFAGFADLRFEVDLAWPAAVDPALLVRAVQPVLAETQGELARARVELRQVRERLAQLERSDTQARIQEAVDAFARRAANDRSLEVRQVTRARLAAQRELVQLNQQYQELADHLRRIEASTIFRATRPLVRAKEALDRWLGRARVAPPVARPRAEPIAATVDVIVPVYLNVEATRRCIEAVLACPVRTPWRLVLVNDASPEPALASWLRELAARDSRVVLLENPENLGFSGTVNRGMALSDEHDVVLLNSDAEVANDWLDRLRAPAYSDARVCSVTPFSNNATICSYPEFCGANPMPPDCSVAVLDRAFALANAGQVLDVPTGVGFCMYIRRDCLREVGLFDTEQFGKGYGEEDDFCRRAAEAGWRNLHALDVFVQHTGGVSFGPSKQQRELEAMAKLRQLHPDYEPLVHEYIRLDPPAAARRRADQALAALRGLAPQA
jgi:O-antigen biosynthesis protein